ncbi:GNAT family N-acetyltransferase [Lipingzhangella sp. LS1_29]|uniref:GNAT family N-acetyltransferase n=1 Tax=Lipingzhangella rawalii TaxID=2055835 RepID=A0ABU2H6D5_9ACTN|nr:GNAT family N-acetyltransferase [Lipingzhangella rawalii]MDS1270867.1 GNAT family N-acetyltransferase [Lipingzhangella rawalii]
MDVTIWHLEQTSPQQLRPARAPGLDTTVARVEEPLPEFNRFLYTAVGGNWHWTSRLAWTYEQWRDWLNRDGVETWVAMALGAPAGYVELDGTAPGEVEIAYFGLMPQRHGYGLGGHLLTLALRRAWDLALRWTSLAETERVSVQTCSLDSPAALANYQSRGMRIYRTETSSSPDPGPAIGPWPGARAAAPASENPPDSAGA